tara:strand:+ start:103 stop:354 length:252 start_codon:yes stop_codon:yes gene_type:complete
MHKVIDTLTREVLIEISNELEQEGKTILDLPIDTINDMSRQAFTTAHDSGLLTQSEEIPFKRMLGQRFIRMAERLGIFQRDWA